MDRLLKRVLDGLWPLAEPHLRALNARVRAIEEAVAPPRRRRRLRTLAERYVEDQDLDIQVTPEILTDFYDHIVELGAPGDCECGKGALDRAHYMVENGVWEEAGLEPGDVACLGCLSRRLGRRLVRTDFEAVPINESVRDVLDNVDNVDEGDCSR